MTANINSDESVGWRFIVFASLFTPIQVAIVFLRFYARSLTSSAFNFGDALIVVSLLGQFVATGIAIGITYSSVLK
jgi:hypothetical protein